MILKPEPTHLDGGGKREVVVHQHIIVINRDNGWLNDFSGVHLGALNVDVITLPETGPARGVYQRWAIFVKGGALSIENGRVVEGVEYLQFGEAANEDAAVAAALPRAFHFCGRGPFDVQMAAGDGIFLSADADQSLFAGALRSDHFHVTVFHLPDKLGALVGVFGVGDRYPTLRVLPAK